NTPALRAGLVVLVLTAAPQAFRTTGRYCTAVATKRLPARPVPRAGSPGTVAAQGPGASSATRRICPRNRSRGQRSRAAATPAERRAAGRFHSLYVSGYTAGTTP